jgi:hypothetical protein
MTIEPFDVLVIAAGAAGVGAFVGTLIARSALPPDGVDRREGEPEPEPISPGLRRGLKVSPPLRFSKPRDPGE